MGKNSRRRTRAQRPATSNVRSPPERQPKTKGLPQGERTSLEDDWIDASITELDPKDDFDLDVVKRLIDEALSRLPAPKDGIDLETVKQLIDEALSVPLAALPQQQQRKRGRKFKDNWPMLVAKEMVRLVRRDDEILENINALIEHMRNFLEGEISWRGPNDDKEIRAQIRFLLGH